MSGNTIHALGMMLAPLGTWAIIAFAFSIKWFIHKHMKDGWLKNQILKERFYSSASESHRKSFSKYK